MSNGRDSTLICGDDRRPRFSSPAGRRFPLNGCHPARPHPEEPPTGPRVARPDERLRGVSKDEWH